MAKKVVSKSGEKKQTAIKKYSKCIKMIKSETGAYKFEEQMIQNDNTEDFFKTI